MVRKSAPALKEMCGVQDAQQVRRHALLQPGALGGDDARLPEYFAVMGVSARQPATVPGKEPRLRLHPAVVRAERREQRGAERDVAITPALPLLNVNQHAPAVDVRDLQMPQFRIPHAGWSKTISIVRCERLCAALINRVTSSTLRICGNRRGTFG